MPQGLEDVGRDSVEVRVSSAARVVYPRPQPLHGVIGAVLAWSCTLCGHSVAV